MKWTNLNKVITDVCSINREKKPKRCKYKVVQEKLIVYIYIDLYILIFLPILFKICTFFLQSIYAYFQP